MAGKKPKLEVGMIPANAWGQNVRAIVSESSWSMLRYRFGAIYDSYSNYPDPALPLTCECCGGQFLENLHLHELWCFDDEQGTQTLTGFKVVCEDCHNSIHIGRANKVGIGDVARQHLMKVNGWSDRQLINHLEKAQRQWVRRLGVEYSLDVKWLIDQGLLSPREIHMSWLKRPARVFDRVGAIEWARDILELPDVVILDTETTGLIEGFDRNPEAEIIELAIITTSGETLYERRFKPLHSIPDRAKKIHGITNTMVRRSPSFAKEYSKIIEILHGKIIVTYNSRFDSKIFDNTCKLHGLPLPDHVTWECAMRVFKAYLEPATRFVKLPNGCHSALGDCHATLDLIHSMAKNEDIQISDDIEQQA
ncbi:MAG: 3'-5' exonuclease [Nitrosomonadales bacterium]|nr:3'-5' exonuclease [Nitrosomonadales bacterium]